MKVRTLIENVLDDYPTIKGTLPAFSMSVGAENIGTVLSSILKMLKKERQWKSKKN